MVSSVRERVDRLRLVLVVREVVVATVVEEEDDNS